MNYTVYNSALLVVNYRGIIIDASPVAKGYLSDENLKGKTIEQFKDRLEKFQVYLAHLRDYQIYVIKKEEDINGFLEFVIENSYDEIFVTDGEGITLYCNEAFEKHYGIKRSDIIGKDVKILEEQGIVDKILVHDVIRSKKMISYEQHTANGKTILNTIKPILDDRNNVMYIVENCRDISEMSFLRESMKSMTSKMKKMEKSRKYFNTISTENMLKFSSKAMLKLDSTIKNLAIRDVNILLMGESGTGKTLMANRVHELSLKRDKPFVNIDCTTIPAELMESELFGYEKGSFTGALKSGKKGLVEQANNGTLFLDEIGELPLALQAKLLQLVQEKTYTSVGSVYPKKIDVRIIAATNRDLLKLVEEGKFRGDLYYRLALGIINIPSLRERKEDIPTLIDYYLEMYNEKYDTNLELDPQVREILINYNWPGNIRELQHLLEFLVIDSKPDDRYITKNSLPSNLTENIVEESIAKEIVSTSNSDNIFEMGKMDLNELVEGYKKEIITKLYDNCKSSYKVAEKLSISQSTAHRLIKKYVE